MANQYIEENPTDHKDSINSYIKTAWAIAEKAVMETGIRFIDKPGRDGKHFRYCVKTEVFHKTMTDLTVKAGLRVL